MGVGKTRLFGFFFHCFSTKKKGGAESLGENEERNSWKRGQTTSFHRSNCLISGRVAIKYGLTVVDYIIPMKGHITVKWTSTSMEDLMIVPLC